MPLPRDFPSPNEQQADEAIKTSFQDIIDRYQAVTNMAKDLILAEVGNHDADNAPEEWERFRQETEDHPELVYDVLATVIDIAAEAILELSKSPDGDTEEEGDAAADPEEQLESLLLSMSDQDVDEEGQG